MVSEAVQTNGINNGNNVYTPYLVTSSNNLQFKHTQQNIVVISQPHSIPTQNSLPPHTINTIKEPLPCVTSRSQMSSQNLANAYNLPEPNYSSRQQQGTTTHHELHQPSPSTQQQIPSHIASKFPGYKLQVYHIDGGPDSQDLQTQSAQGLVIHPGQHQQQAYEGSVLPHQVRMSAHTSSAAKSRAMASMEKKHHPKGGHHTHLHQHHQHSHHQHGVSHTHHQGKVKLHDVSQPQHHSSPKHRKNHQQDDRRNHNKLQKSRSDGQLLDDSGECHSTDQSSISIGSHSHAGLRNINTPRSHPSCPVSHQMTGQKYTPLKPDFDKRFSQHPPPSCSEEEEISDRDMPELAPIGQHEHTCMMGGGTSFKGNMEYVHATQPCEKHDPSRIIPVQRVSSSYSPLDSNILSGHLPKEHSREKASAEYAEDMDRDIGQALSPLGSTSSLQDLIESVSVPSRGDGSSKSEKLIATSLWAEQTRALHAEQHTSVVSDLGRVDTSSMYAEGSTAQELHNNYELGNKRDIKSRNWNMETASVPQHEEREPSTSSLKSAKSGKKLKTVKVVAPEDMDADSGRGTSEDMHHHHALPSTNVDMRPELRRPKMQMDRQNSKHQEQQDLVGRDNNDASMQQRPSIIKDSRMDDTEKTFKEEIEPCIEVEEETTAISFQHDIEEEKQCTEESDNHLIIDEHNSQQDSLNVEEAVQNVARSNTVTQCMEEEHISSDSFQAIDEEGKIVDPDRLPIKMIDNEDVGNAHDIISEPKTEEIDRHDNESLIKEEDVTCEDESGLGTTEKDIKEVESVSDNRDTHQRSIEKEQVIPDEEPIPHSPKTDSSTKGSHKMQDTSNVSQDLNTNDNGAIWHRIQSDRGDVRKKAEAFEEKIKSMSQSTENDENEQHEKSLPSSLLSGDEDDIKVLRHPQVPKRVEENIVSPDMMRSDDETTSQHVDSEAVFRSSCDEDDLVNTPIKREEDDGSVISSIERPSSTETPQANIICAASPPPIAPKPKKFANGLLKDKNLNSKNEAKATNNSIPQVTEMPKVTVSVEPNNGVPLVEPPAGFGDSPIKSVKVVEIKEFEMKSSGLESSHTVSSHEEKTDESNENKPMIHEGMYPKQQFANVEVLPNIDNDENLADPGPIYHRPAEMQIEELTSLSSALEIAPLETYPSGKQDVDYASEQKHLETLEMPPVHALPGQANIKQECVEKEYFSPKEQHSSLEKRPKAKSRKSSSGSRERSDIVTSSSNASMQSVQVGPDTHPAATSASSSSKGKVRSRSSSKERLLSTLANAGDAPITSHEEDDISGKKKKSILKP